MTSSGRESHDRSVRAVAEEALRRLAVDLPREGSGERGDRLIDGFCNLLVHSDPELAPRFVDQVRSGGIGFRELHLRWLAPAARRLGDDWVRDLRNFASVGLGVSRLHRILHALGRDVSVATENDLGAATEVPSALMTIPPNESHTLGTEIFANLLRHDGWSVDLSVGEPEPQLAGRVQTRAPAVIVLVSYDPDADPCLTELVRRLRAAGGGRSRIVLAGGLLAHASASALRAADALLPDLESAVERMNGLTGR